MVFRKNSLSSEVPMNEMPKNRTRAFFEYDYKKMAEGGFKAKGWMFYNESPYKQHKTIMEGMGYEGKDKFGDHRSDT